MPVDEPKLERMSLRTTPLWVSTFGPFEPSPGYGPAVSSGIVDRSPVVVAVVGGWLLSLLVPALAAVPAAVEDVVESPPLPHAASAVARDAGDRAAGEQLQHPPARHHRVQVEREPAIVVVDLVVVGGDGRPWVPSCRARAGA